MLRSIGSVTALALFMVGCGGGGGDSDPPPPATYTVGGTVSGLVGSGLTLDICPPGVGHRGFPPPLCTSELQISANGAFTLGSAYPAGYSGGDYVVIVQQPSSPGQNCVIVNASGSVPSVSVQSLSDTSVTVSCPGEYAYVANAADNTFSSYRVDATTGALALIGTPTATGVSPHAIVGYDYYDGPALKRYLFVANAGSNNVSAFTVDVTTGAITEVPGSPFPSGIDPQAMAIYGPDLFVANAGSDNVSVYTIGSAGVLTAQPGSPIAVGKSPTSILVDPHTGIVFVANHGGSNDISAFYFYDLTPVPGSPFSAGGNPLGLAIGFWQGGSFLYTANPDATNPSISGLSVDSNAGATSPLSGSPFQLPVSHYIATETTGSHLSSYLYVTSDASILGYASDIATGALTALPGFPVATGANAYSITIDPYNQFLYVANDGAGNISGFKLDASTGALTPMAGSPFPAGSHPEFIATF